MKPLTNPGTVQDTRHQKLKKSADGRYRGDGRFSNNEEKVERSRLIDWIWEERSNEEKNIYYGLPAFWTR